MRYNLAVIAAAALTTAAAALPRSVAAVDHFTCYRTGTTSGSAPFAGISDPPGVTLVDRFGNSTVAVKKPKYLCAPTNKLGEDPDAPNHADDLQGYQLKNRRMKPVLPGRMRIVDQFNPTGLLIAPTKQSHLLVP